MARTVVYSITANPPQQNKNKANNIMKPAPFVIQMKSETGIWSARSGTPRFESEDAAKQFAKNNIKNGGKYRIVISPPQRVRCRIARWDMESNGVQWAVLV